MRLRPFTIRAVLVRFVVVLAAAAQAAGTGSDALTGGVFTHNVARGETLRSIGSRLGVDPATLAAENGRDLGAILPAGVTLNIDNRHIVPELPDRGRIVINIPQRMLFFGAADGVVGFPVAVGRRGWQTPEREFTVISKEMNPTWNVPASIRAEARREGRELPAVVPPGPANPLGRYWIGLSIPGVGIHGTNAPTSIFQAVTHGCIRLHPDDIESLFGQVEVGARGRVIYEPVLLAAMEADVFVESHPDIYNRGVDRMAVARRAALARGMADRIDWEDARRIIERREGVARRVRLRSTPGAPADAPDVRGSSPAARQPDRGAPGCQPA